MNIKRMREWACLVLLVIVTTTVAQGKSQDEMGFVKLQRDFAGTVLSYQKGATGEESPQGKALVIYLHGGSSCGTDNTTQMGEPGIDSICHYLTSRHIPAVMVVPQCPDRNRGWGGLAKNVKALLDFTVRTEGVDSTRIYIFGGSMGGTGTWKMLSTFPNYFAAGMPCAANPKGMSATNVATTPVYNVMGLADKIMGSDVRVIAENFISQLQSLGDEVRYETVEGWSHEMTCIQSYSTERLDWVLTHRRNLGTDIKQTRQDVPEDDDTWYTLLGMRISKPSQAGIFIRKGKKIVVR